MTEATTLVSTPRPIRELIDPSVEEPLPRDEGSMERRKEHRFNRRLPGVLSANALDHPIRCDDVSYRGVRLTAPRSLSVRRGQQVRVRLEQGSRVFQDEYTVRGSESTTDDTILHLGQ